MGRELKLRTVTHQQLREHVTCGRFVPHAQMREHGHEYNTELVAMLLATASVALLAEHRTRFARSRVRFPAGWSNFAFFTTGHGWVLKYLHTGDFPSTVL